MASKTQATLSNTKTFSSYLTGNVLGWHHDDSPLINVRKIIAAHSDIHMKLYNVHNKRNIHCIFRILYEQNGEFPSVKASGTLG